MKFINSIVLTLGFSSAALAGPILEKKQSTVVGAVSASLSTLQGTLGTYEGAISTLSSSPHRSRLVSL